MVQAKKTIYEKFLNHMNSLWGKKQAINLIL